MRKGKSVKYCENYTREIISWRNIILNIFLENVETMKCYSVFEKMKNFRGKRMDLKQNSQNEISLNQKDKL